MTIVPVLLTLAALPAHQFQFLNVLLPLWLAIPGRINARSFSRYIGWNERSLRRHFSKALPWHALHMTLMHILLSCGVQGLRLILVMDASFIPKAGRKTFGRGSFWNGCAGKAETGLELSCIALMSWVGHHTFPISVRQTRPKTQKADRLTQYLDQLRGVFRLHRAWLRRFVKVVVKVGSMPKRCSLTCARTKAWPSSLNSPRTPISGLPSRESIRTVVEDARNGNERSIS